MSFYVNVSGRVKYAFVVASSRRRGSEVLAAPCLNWPRYRIVELASPTERVTRLLLRLGLTRNGPRTHAQSRELAEAAVRFAPHLSDRKLATLVGLTHPTIAKARQKLSTLQGGSSRMVDTNPPRAIQFGSDDLRMRTRSRTGRSTNMRTAVFAGTAHNREPHFIGWHDDVDVDGLFATGTVFGVTLRRVPAVGQVISLDQRRRRKLEVEAAA